MTEYIFSKLIKCKRCGKNYRGIQEYKTNAYVCNGFSMYGSSYCSRGLISEKELLFVIERNQGREVEVINMWEDKIVIHYKDGHQSIISNDQIVF